MCGEGRYASSPVTCIDVDGNVRPPDTCASDEKYCQTSEPGRTVSLTEARRIAKEDWRRDSRAVKAWKTVREEMDEQETPEKHTEHTEHIEPQYDTPMPGRCVSYFGKTIGKRRSATLKRIMGEEGPRAVYRSMLKRVKANLSKNKHTVIVSSNIFPICRVLYDAGIRSVVGVDSANGRRVRVACVDGRCGGARSMLRSSRVVVCTPRAVALLPATNSTLKRKRT